MYTFLYVPVFGNTCTLRCWSICTFICVRTFTIGVDRKGSLLWSQARIVSVLKLQLDSALGISFLWVAPPPLFALKWNENGCAIMCARLAGF